MSNWIDEEAEKYRVAKELEERKENLILYSEYWSDVKLQIEKDVKQINNHEVWKSVLRYAPLKIAKTSSDSYEIEKERFPEVFVSVQNKKDAIEVTTKIKRKDESNWETKTEVLKVDSDGEKIYLERNKETFCVPEETAQHILTPIMKALNKTL